MTRTIDQIIASEVLCCMSSLVATLAQGYGAAVTNVDAYGHRSTNGGDLANLTEQAFELAAPIDDWEEAAIQAGYTIATGGPYFCAPDGTFVSDDEGTIDPTADDAWCMLCDTVGIDPYETEVYEHWAVTDWFADKLEAAGEKVDRDFAGLCVWARTTTGQQISADEVVTRIYAQTHTGLEG